MKRGIVFGLVAIVVLLFGSLAMAGVSAPCLSAPTTFICPTDDVGVNFSWDVLTGANKYSIDVVVTSLDGLTIVEQTFSTNTNSLSVPFTDFLICGDAVAKVKGLNPPGGQTKCSQSNPFSSECDFTVPCP